MAIYIADDQRGLVFKRGNYIRHLKPGKHFMLPFNKRRVLVMDVSKPFHVPEKNLSMFLTDPELVKELAVVTVKEHELALHFEDGLLVEVFRAGRYGFWNVLKKHDFMVIDTREPEIRPEFVPLLSSPKIQGFFALMDVAGHETGLLFFNNIFQRKLDPGRYFFWNGPVSVNVIRVDLRQQQIDMTGQEIMTEDKVTLRINFVCHYRITDPMKIVAIKSYEDQLYIQLQLILREYVGSLKLDDLLAKKQEVGAFVLDRLKEKGGEYGVEFLSVGLKDLILPGDVKEILNMVLIAEKKAQANVITRREEVASTRSLLNTAKLMEENQTLYRLKELEFLEKICEKIGNISVMGGGNLLEQLNSLLETGKK